MTPATDIITRLIGYARHDEDCGIGFSADDIKCTCGYSAAIADAREFLEGESEDGK